MNSILENAGRLTAAVTLALLSLSAIYEWGYFQVIGVEFQRFVSPSDYLSNAIEWLPYLVLVLLLVAVLALFNLAFDRSKRERLREDFVNGTLAVLAFSFMWQGFRGLRGAEYWSVFLAVLFIALWSISGLVFFGPFRNTASKFQRSTRVLLLIAPLSAAFAYYTGVESGYQALLPPTDPYVVENREGKELIVGLLKTFERGVLVRDAANDTSEFIRWEEVRTIKHHRAAERRPTSLCSRYMWNWLSWLCVKDWGGI